MSGIYLRIVTTLLAFSLALQLASADTSTLKPPPSDETDVVMLLDASGSMRVTDPERLRDEGAKVIFQFLKAGDRLGIVQFDADARVIRDLSAFRDDERGLISDQIAQVDNSGMYTNIYEGIRQAKDLLDKSENKGGKVIVLLSDGKMDPDPDAGTAEDLTDRLFDSVLPELKKSGVKLYSLAFSKQADRDLLSKIALATDGVGIYAEQPSEIQSSFSDLFLAVKKPQVLPLRGRGFEVDAEVSEATFYIKNDSGSDVYLETPFGAQITRDSYPSGVTWYEGKQFEVITISAPEVGVWKILGLSNADGFATVLTNLKLVTDWPANVLAGSKRLLQVRLYDGKKPVVLPNMSDTAKFSFQVTPTDKVSEPIIREILNDNGEQGDEKAKDGIFSGMIHIEDPGLYKLSVIAKGPTFERQQFIPFRVKDRLVSLEVVAVESLGEKAGKSRDFLRVTLGSDAVGLKNIEVKLSAKTEDKRSFSLPIEQSEENSMRYEIPAAILPEDGTFLLEASLNALDKKKKPVFDKSQILKYVKVTKEDDEEVPELAVVLAHEEKEEEAPPPIIPYALLLTLINAGAGSFAFLTLKKSQGDIAVAAPKYEPGAELLAAIASLEQLAGQTEIAADDPRLIDATIPEPPDFSKGVVVSSSEDSDQDQEESGSVEPQADPADMDEGAQETTDQEGEQDATEAEPAADNEEPPAEEDLGLEEEDDDE